MFRQADFIQDRAIRAALVGCGRISQKHIEAFEKIDSKKMQLVAVCDSNLDSAKIVGNKIGVEALSSFEVLLNNPEIDVVVLATPSGIHAEQAIRALKAGKHVITEKPMATRWADGKSMVAAADASGKSLFVVKQNRLNRTLKILKQSIDAGRLGKIFLVQVNVFWCRPQSYYDSSSWRGTWEFDGGALMNQASHYVDLMEWLVGPVDCVQALSGTLARNIEVEDTAVVNLRWRSGALGSAAVTMLTYKQNLEGSITILGERGSVRIGGIALNKIEHWDFDEPHALDDEAKDASYGTSSVYGHGHGLFYEAVANRLRGGTDPISDGREGLRSLEILIASYLSARDGNKISLPLDY